jgi:hypothetical protein
MNDNNKNAAANPGARGPAAQSRAERHLQKFVPLYALLATTAFVGFIGWGGGLASQSGHDASGDGFTVTKFQTTPEKQPMASGRELAKRNVRDRPPPAVISSKLIKEDAKISLAFKPVAVSEIARPAIAPETRAVAVLYPGTAIIPPATREQKHVCAGRHCDNVQPPVFVYNAPAKQVAASDTAPTLKPVNAPASQAYVSIIPAGTNYISNVRTAPPNRKPRCAEEGCAEIRGKVLDDNSARVAVTGNNTEIETSADEGNLPFSISVDGKPVAGAKKPVDAKRKTDVALEEVDIQVKFDGLDVRPILNVSTIPPRRVYHPGENVNFLASWNYAAWIAKAEVLIFEKSEEDRDEPLYVVPVSPEGAGVWSMPVVGPRELVYVLRVYDKEGQFDETLPLSLLRASKLPGHADEEKEDAVAPGYGEDRTAVRNIQVYGGAITVYGTNVPPGHYVTVLGEAIPVDPEQSFVVQRILPPGDHTIDVNVEDKSGKGLAFNREINVPSSEWFYVALADLTVGRKFTSDKIAKADSDEFDKVYTKGRLAYYLKGKIKGRYLLTSAVDTGEDDIENIFKGLDSKDPRQFLRRLDPDDYYPIYGDESVAIEDAPTRGKFYVRLERGDSSLMWGNFHTRIDGTEFLRNERALYGANAVYRSEKTVSAGERKTEVSIYAAQPGTLPQRDVLRGTGGSAYFLKHQDITVGSETVTIEIRDETTGRVLERRLLRYGFDYDIDYIQGIVILKRPLGSTVGSGDVVRDGALDGDQSFLIVNYEYTPAAGEADGYVHGGRGQQWLGNKVRVGVTAMNEKTGPADQRLYGADVLVRHSDSTYVEAEVAQSKGPGFGNSFSTDGGLTINDSGTVGIAGRKAEAYRVEGHAGLDDLTGGRAEGDLGVYYEKKQSGFSSLASQSGEGQEIWGGHVKAKVTDRIGVAASYDERKASVGREERQANAEAHHNVTDHWTVSPGIKNSKRKSPLDTSSRQGERTDAGAKLAYRFDDDNVIFVFGQATVDRSGGRRAGDRVGIGGKKLITEKLSASAEVSEGVGGVGGLASLDYAPTADDHYYLGYRLDPDRWDSFDYPYALDGRDLGVIVAGAKHSLTETLSAYAEDNYDMFGKRTSLTQTYGVNYTPDARWTLGGGIEIGTIYDDSINPTTGLKNSDFDRTAVSLSAGYRDEDSLSGRMRGEARFEESEDKTRDRDTYLIGAGLGYSILDDWRAIANVDAVISDKTSDTIRDGDYVEGSLGYAYRAADNDRLNALFKYTFLYDLPGPDQVTVEGTTLGPAQRSHILSADASYDLTELITIGGKYGFRIGETKPRDGGDWEDGSAHLGILRTDLHIVRNWDVLLEGRVLWTPEADAVKYGALAAVYRHFGDNFKFGAGYNFGSFSDDLRDLTYDDHGVFVNAIAKL